MTPPIPGVYPSDVTSLRQVPGRGIFYTRDTQFRVLSTNLVILAAGATVPNVQVQVGADAAFQVVKMAAALYGPANAILTNEFELDAVLVEIRVTENSRFITDVAVPLSSLVGNGRLPFILPYPLVLSDSSQISHTFTNLNGAAERRVRLQYIGLAHFDLRKQDLAVS